MLNEPLFVPMGSHSHESWVLGAGHRVIELKARRDHPLTLCFFWGWNSGGKALLLGRGWCQWRLHYPVFSPGCRTWLDWAAGHDFGNRMFSLTAVCICTRCIISLSWARRSLSISFCSLMRLSHHFWKPLLLTSAYRILCWEETTISAISTCW